ncbi:unnamed protein product [Caenorhabditis angaria]|uniref:C2H2-type domain-containing protein n=1 Tax=Caenorhabditis angaria TaxID=860376 RepID=A0A9P1IST8_9PELO|nr:unnamed protein product [Caenorhabditis angaria]
MNDGPVAKKCRIWNPAISDSTEEEEVEKQQKPLDFSAAKNMQIFQNYLQLAPLMMRFQQHQQELARRQFLLTNFPPIQIAPPPPQLQPSPPSPATTTSTSPLTNPIVASTLGTPLVNENCCAVCGANFRLTGDLVQHMRNNHRKSKFKRKSEK